MNVLAFAFWTQGWNLFRIPAVMAQQPAIPAVIRQGNRAVDALNALPTGAAGDKRREAAPIEQDHRLFIVLKPLADGLDQNPGKNRVPARLEELLPHVDDVHDGHWPAGDPIRH